MVIMEAIYLRTGNKIYETMVKFWTRIFALEVAIFALISLFTVVGGHSLTRAREGLDGGLVGWGLVEAVSSLIGLIGTGVLAFVFALGGAVIGLGFTQKVKEQLDLIQADPLPHGETGFSVLGQSGLDS
mgnify:CR=1 FL=1